MMKRNMQFIALALTFLFLNVNGVLAQDRSYDGTIRIKPVRLEQLGEFIHVDLDVVLEDVKVKSARGVDLIPQLVSSTTTYDLPRVSIKGRNEYLVYERRLAVMSRKEKNSHKLPYRVEKNTKKQSGVIQYRYVLPYEAWMADAWLNVQRDECGCGESTLMNVEHTFDKVTLERMLVPYIVTPYLSYVEPMVEEIKSRDVQAEAFLDFEVNKVDIRPEYMNNPKELAKIRAMIDDLRFDTNVKVNRLDIIGYASPEGTLEVNKRLSEGRAMALRNYLATQYDFPAPPDGRRRRRRTGRSPADGSGPSHPHRSVSCAAGRPLRNAGRSPIPAAARQRPHRPWGPRPWKRRRSRWCGKWHRYPHINSPEFWKRFSPACSFRHRRGV